MAADLKEAVENFKTEARRFQSMFELSEELSKLGDLTRAAASARQQIAGRERALADLEARIADATLRASEAERQARKMEASAQAATAAHEKELNDLTRKIAAARSEVTRLFAA